MKKEAAYHVFLFKSTVSSCSTNALYLGTPLKCQDALYSRTEGVYLKIYFAKYGKKSFTIFVRKVPCFNHVIYLY